ncbi:MAG: L,D-transpeptidase [Rhodothalassiaceae bacterium]
MIRVRVPAGATTGTLAWGVERAPCQVGRAGLIAAADKREGDGATPCGCWPLRALYYRPDRLAVPPGRLRAMAITPQMLWCDDPEHPAYNRPVQAPFGGRHERLWRQDHRYDLIVVLGFNDDPPVPGRGSAIFLHLTEALSGSTAGCVAVARPVLARLLAQLGAAPMIEIAPAGLCPDR